MILTKIIKIKNDIFIITKLKENLKMKLKMQLLPVNVCYVSFSSSLNFIVLQLNYPSIQCLSNFGISYVCAVDRHMVSH